MALRMSRAVASRMHRHAQAEYPRECCGILVGRLDNGHRRVERIVEADNVEPTRVHDRFVLDPRTLFEVDRETRGTEAAIVGFYHSHPDHPCRPSATDFQFAADWPDHAFLIVEVREHVAVGCRSWVVPDGGTAFVEEPVEIV